MDNAKENKDRILEVVGYIEQNLDKIHSLFPKIKELLRMENLCRHLGFGNSLTKAILEMKPVGFKGKLYSSEYSRHFETEHCGHGRIETRKCSILRAKEYLLEENLQVWKDISTLVRVESIREVNTEKSIDIRYFISDEDIDKARYYSSLVRDHWSIENSLHWHLDVTFREDACRARSGHAPANLSVVRKFALQLIARQKDKLSLKKRLYKAALDSEYLKKIIHI